jgi:adenine-specific DNA-methyltransferase
VQLCCFHTLYYIFNSELLNWRFKITSSNNHINNYELGDLPIINLDLIDLDKFSNNELINDELICKLYGLTDTETEYLLGTKKKTEYKIEYEQEAV